MLAWSSKRIAGRRTRLLLHSFQFPTEALQRTQSFIGTNGKLAIFPVGGTYQAGDVVELLFDTGDILTELRFLLAG